LDKIKEDKLKKEKELKDKRDLEVNKEYDVMTKTLEEKYKDKKVNYNY